MKIQIKVPANTVLPTSTGLFAKAYTTAHAPRMCENIIFHHLYYNRNLPASARTGEGVSEPAGPNRG